MTDTATPAAPQGTAAPIVPPVIAATPAAPVPPVADDPDLVKMPSAKLRERLAEEAEKGAKRAAEQFAKDLGVDIATAKKLIADAKARSDAEKSEVQRLTEQLAERDAKLAEFGAYKSAVEVRAAAEMAGLTEAQRVAVLAIAKDSPALQLQTIETLRPTWAAAAEAHKVATEAAAKAAAEAAAKAAAPPPGPAGAPAASLAAPASTAPANPPPAPPSPGSPVNHLAEYERLKAAQPYAAATYFNQHANAIIAARKTNPTATPR